MPARALIRGVSFGLAMWCATGVLILAPLGAVAWPARPIGSVASGSWEFRPSGLGWQSLDHTRQCGPGEFPKRTVSPNSGSSLFQPWARKA